MKRLLWLGVVIAAVWGAFASGRASGQQQGQTLICQSTLDGGPSVQCSQYLVQVQVQRGFPRFTVWQAQGEALKLTGEASATTFSLAGEGSEVAIQAFELADSYRTFTLSLSEP